MSQSALDQSMFQATPQQLLELKARNLQRLQDANVKIVESCKRNEEIQIPQLESTEKQLKMTVQEL